MSEHPADTRLIAKLVNRMMQFRVERLKSIWNDSGRLLGDDPGPEGLTREDEALALIAIVRAHDVPKILIGHAGSEEGERVFGLCAGHVLTDQDVAAIEKILADHNDEIERGVTAFDDGRRKAFHELGGDELVALVDAADKARVKATVAKVMDKFRAQLAARTEGESA